MARNKLSRNSPCPCGSGKKYKHCCFGKEFDFVEEDDGTIYKSIPLSDEMTEFLDEHRQAFIEEHGREPGPNDRVFGNMPPLEHVEHQMVEAMKEAELDPAFIYAFEKTGRIVGEHNQDLLTDEELEEWVAAIEEYEAKHGRPQQQPPEFPIGTVACMTPDGKNRRSPVCGG